MKYLLILLLSLFANSAKSQTPLYPEDRTNRVFVSGLSSAITYTVSYALFNNQKPIKKHLYPIITTMGVNVCLGGLSYLVDKSAPINKRQNITAWFGGSIVTVTILRIGIN